MRLLDRIRISLDPARNCAVRDRGRWNVVAGALAMLAFVLVTAIQSPPALADNAQGAISSRPAHSAPFEVLSAEARAAPADPSQPVIYVKLSNPSAKRLLDVSSKMIGETLLMFIDDRIYSRVVVQSPISGGSVQIWVSDNAESLANQLQTGESSLYLVPASRPR